MLMPGLLSEITVKIYGTSLQDEQITGKAEDRNMKLTVSGTIIDKLSLRGGIFPTETEKTFLSFNAWDSEATESFF